MKKALLVGINKYAMVGNDLAGCVNDVLDMRDVLIKYRGFAVEDIRVVTDERATLGNIFDRLKWLTEGATSGDSLVFHFSGHGSQVRDRNGDELKDGMDEILCPHDMDWDGIFISDDDLQDAFSKLPQGVTLDVILDSCHSGTATRAGCFCSDRPFKAKYLSPPADIACRGEGPKPKRGLFSWILSMFDSPVIEDSKPIITMNHALFAGCQDKQYSADAQIGGAPHGAFTYYFCEAIRKVGGNISRNILKNEVKEALDKNGFEQIPQLEAPRALFYGSVFA